MEIYRGRILGEDMSENIKFCSIKFKISDFRLHFKQPMVKEKEKKRIAYLVSNKLRE